MLMAECSSGGDQRSYLLTRDNALDIAVDIEVENHNRKAVFLAERDRGGVHYAQTALEHVEIADGFDHGRGAHSFWIGVINPVDLGGFHDHIGLDFHGAE